MTALAANISAQDTDQKHLFYSGVAFGVAAGALISLVLELIPADPVKRDRGRGQQGAVSTRCYEPAGSRPYRSAMARTPAMNISTPSR